jgi:hypothetical protein
LLGVLSILITVASTRENPMTTYKAGDDVLVRAKIVDRVKDGWRIQVPHQAYMYRVRNSDIHGLAPEPETDWTKVPMGARVRVRDYECEEWRPGRLVSYDHGTDDTYETAFQVLPDRDGEHEVEWFNQCELVEEGDE